MPGYQIAAIKPAPTAGVGRLPGRTERARTGQPPREQRLHWYLRLHLLCLVLYCFFGKGFASVGTRFFYVSEALLALGLFPLIMSRRTGTLVGTPIGLAMLPFFLWQSACAIPYFGVYGFTVARDAVVWGYAAFAWILAAVVIASPNPASGVIDEFMRRYRRFASWFLIFGPLAVFLSITFSATLPKWPGTGVAFIGVKFDEFEVHLAGIAALVVTGLNPANWWLPLIGFGVLFGMANRGGLVGFLGAFVVACLLMRRVRAMLLPLIMLVVLVIAGALNVSIPIPGSTRELSASQFVNSLDSTVSSDATTADTGDLENTREWRLGWWRKIWDYTVRGPYFWTGKGYGLNVAVDDGYVGDDDSVASPLRSPHNSHMTFLARSGVPGFLLWITLQFTWLGTMLRSFFRAKRLGKVRWAGLFAWLISYWTAFVVAASFDVFLENPMAAIPFWTLFGLGWGAQIIFDRYRFAPEIVYPRKK